MHTVMCLNFGTPKIINFPFGTNGKLIILGVPIMKHIMVYHNKTKCSCTIQMAELACNS